MTNCESCKFAVWDCDGDDWFVDDCLKCCPVPVVGACDEWEEGEG